MKRIKDKELRKDIKDNPITYDQFQDALKSVCKKDDSKPSQESSKT